MQGKRKKREQKEGNEPMIKRGMRRKREVTSRRPRIRFSNSPSDLIISNTSLSSATCSPNHCAFIPHMRS